jgi:holo-[acyl-carrier protein] synthase
MQIYQGVDLVEISKFKELFMKHEGFVSDIFTVKEADYCAAKKDPYIHFAGRFAAKEAGLKALGIGMSGTGIDNTLKEIEVLNTASGKPELFFHGWAEKISTKRKISQATVSISHSGNYAVATVILTGENEKFNHSFERD